MAPRSVDAPVIVTGGAGAIGSVLVRALLERGHFVRVADNFSSGRRGHLPAEHPRLEVHTVDLRQPSSLDPVVQGAQELWHLAANPDIRLGTERSNLDLEHGTLATYHALDAARRAHVERFLFSSSSVVYGLPNRFPTPEDYGPLLPESLYAASKLASEGLASAYAHCYGLRSYIFRFANIIGPGMTHGVIYDFFEKLRQDPDRLEVLGDGRQAKSYLRTEDCVSGMLLVRDRSKELVSVFNLGSHDRVSVREIAERVVAAHGGHARIEFTGGERGWTGDVPQQLLAIDRVNGLGWEPRYDSRSAVDLTIREMAAQRGL